MIADKLIDQDTMKPRIFISYARSDGKEFALRLRTRLQEEYRFAIWQDLAEMEGGQDWWKQIEAVICHSDLEHLVLVLTPGALQSSVVKDEWQLARREGKSVIPVIADADVKTQIATLPGWMKALHFVDLNEPEQWQRFVRTLEEPAHRQRVPMMAPVPPVDLVARPALFEELQRSLLARSHRDSGPNVTALIGAGGFGKTTLVQALAHDVAVQERFHHGTLCVTLGEAPDLGRHLLDLIEVLTGTRPGYADLHAASSRLRELLAGHACLLVIDDVWQRAHLEPFMHATPSCSWLITTRNVDTSPAGSRRLQVDAMEASQSVAMLQAGLRAGRPADFSVGHTYRLRRLAARLGEWPLLLKLAGAVLAEHSAAGQSLDDALDHVDRALDKRGLVAFDASDREGRNQAAAQSIGISLALLTSEQRERLDELAIFPENINVPLQIVERLWNAAAGYDAFDTQALCSRLFRLSLLLNFDLRAGTIRMHDVIRALLRGESQATRPGQTMAWHAMSLAG